MLILLSTEESSYWEKSYPGVSITQCFRGKGPTFLRKLDKPPAGDSLLSGLPHPPTPSRICSSQFCSFSCSSEATGNTLSASNWTALFSARTGQMEPRRTWKPHAGPLLGFVLWVTPGTHPLGPGPMQGGEDSALLMTRWKALSRRQSYSDGEKIHGCPGLGVGQGCDYEGRSPGRRGGDRIVLCPDCDAGCMC